MEVSRAREGGERLRKRLEKKPRSLAVTERVHDGKASQVAKERGGW
jgi:hypothetical protein